MVIQQGHRRAKIEAYPLSTLKVFTSRERSWGSFSASVEKLNAT